MDISIILCTYNRASSLTRTLETLAHLTIPNGVEVELIVVDNNSSDDTAAVCKHYKFVRQFRYIFEAQQGKSNALNRGIAECTGTFLMFTDDDMDVESDWLVLHWEAAQRVAHAGWFGGRILPRWEETPPPWFERHASSHLAYLVGRFDPGDREMPLGGGVAGANMSIRRSAIAGLMFDSTLGRHGAGNVGGEEIDMVQQLRKRGHEGWYLPQAVMYHRIPAHRMTEAYVRKWFVGDGRTEVRRNQVLRTHQWCGAARYYWKSLLVNGVKFCLGRISGRSSQWLPAEIEIAKAWGVIAECRQQRGRARAEAGPEVS